MTAPTNCDWCGEPATTQVMLRSGVTASLCESHRTWVERMGAVSIFSADFDRLEYAQLEARLRAREAARERLRKRKRSK